MDSSFQKQLNEMFRGFKTLPYLFVGSGFSQRYMELGSWERLLREYAQILSFSDDPDDWGAKYLAYKNTATQQENEAKLNQPASENIEAPQLLYARIASLMESDFDQAWYNDKSFRLQHFDYKDEVLERHQTPFKCDIAQRFSRKFNSASLPMPLQKEINRLRQIRCKNIAGIITTNYDSLLETIFSEFSPFVGQEELLIRQSMGIAEIYKIHGSYSKPESIVITHEDYQRFNDDCQYLAAKLLAFFLENPIIFLGYSIHDWNIQKILGTVVHCLPQKEREGLQKRLFFIQRRHEGEQEGISIVNHPLPGQYKYLPMTCVTLDSFDALYEALANVHSKYSPKILQQLKQDIYELVLSQAPTAQLRVVGLENCGQDERIEAVVGVGVLGQLGTVGYSALNAYDIYEDLVLDNLKDKYKSFKYEDVVRLAFPALLQRKDAHLPFFKYISQMNPADIPEEIQAKIPATYDELIPPSVIASRENAILPYPSVRGIIEHAIEPKKQLYRISFLRENEISLEELETFLKGIFQNPSEVWKTYDGSYGNHLRRLIRIYDWIKYKK